jgi:hypothetical protein
VLVVKLDPCFSVQFCCVGCEAVSVPVSVISALQIGKDKAMPAGAHHEFMQTEWRCSPTCS